MHSGLSFNDDTTQTTSSYSGTQVHLDVIKVSVYATDGFGGTTATKTDQLTIQNTAPVAGTVTISPNPASHASLLTASATGVWSDADSDSLSYSYQWARSTDGGTTFRT